MSLGPHTLSPVIVQKSYLMQQVNLDFDLDYIFHSVHFPACPSPFTYRHFRHSLLSVARSMVNEQNSSDCTKQTFDIGHHPHCLRLRNPMRRVFSCCSNTEDVLYHGQLDDAADLDESVYRVRLH